MITEEKEKKEEDTALNHTLMLAMSIFMLIMVGVVGYLLCMIRNQKRRRTEDTIRQNRETAKIDMSESDSERASPKKPAGNVYSDIATANIHQRTPSNVGLNESKPDPMGTSDKQMINTFNSSTYLPENEKKAIAKQSNADEVSNPTDVKLDFSPNQPQIVFDPKSQP